MAQIKILFFIEGVFFGVDQSRIIAKNTTVTIDPEEKTINILQEKLITILENYKTLNHGSDFNQYCTANQLLMEW